MGIAGIWGALVDMPWSLIWFFAKELLTGEVWRLWATHKAAEKAQSIADTPVTDNEWSQDAKDGKL
jgi:hypothetical protein